MQCRAESEKAARCQVRHQLQRQRPSMQTEGQFDATLPKSLHLFKAPGQIMFKLGEISGQASRRTVTACRQNCVFHCTLSLGSE